MKISIIVFCILVISCATIDNDSKFNEYNRKNEQSIISLKQRYQEVKITSGTPKNIINYFMLNKKALVYFDLKKTLYIDNKEADEDKFASLYFDPIDNKDIKNIKINVSESQSKAECTLHVDMLLYVNQIENSSNSKYDYIYTYEVINAAKVAAKNVYYKSYFIFKSVSTGAEMYKIADYWE